MRDHKLKHLQNIGKKFNNLTVLDVIHGMLFSDKITRFYYICLCDCGNKKTIRADSVRLSSTRSCGCLWLNNHRNKTHGGSHGIGIMAEYKVWTSMKMRCSNPKFTGYKNYGGRGISFCERWKLFENFIADMGRRPSDQHSIDRIDNDGNYEPSNCRWATRQIQNNNTRRQKT